MAEDGILILDQAGGDSIATRDAYETDVATNARFIPRVTLTQGHLISPLGSATRATITAADNAAVASFPADLTNNLITCGDKNTLVVFAEFASACGANQSVGITPIMYDNEASPGVIGTMTKTTLAVTTGDITRNADNTQILSDLVTWELNGASKIGVHVTDANLITNVSIWAWVI